jgi:hypothetical protein
MARAMRRLGRHCRALRRGVEAWLAADLGKQFSLTLPEKLALSRPTIDSVADDTAPKLI